MPPEDSTGAPRGPRERLRESLFPRVAPAGAGLGRGERAILLLAALVLGTVLQLLRPGFDASLNALWAEDGPIFLQGTFEGGFLDAVLSPYAGYLVLVPRLIGEAASLVAIEDAAAAVSILSAATVALCGVVVWHASAGLIRDPWLRGPLAAATVLAPVAGLESVDSAAYVPWYMLFATFWLLLWRPATTLGAVLAALFVLATGLSTPGVWFFAPLAALRALAARDRRDAAILGGFAAGALAQVPVLMSNQEGAVDPAWTGDIWTAYLQRVFDGAALGERLGGAAWAHLGWPFLLALIAAAAAALALGLRRAGPSGRWFAALAIPTSLALFVVSAYQRAVGSEIMWPAGNYHGSAGRYAIVPALLLVSVALVLIDRPPRREGGRPRYAWLAPAVAAVLALGIVTSFDVRDDGVRGTPPWDDALRSGAAACAAEGAPSVAVPTSPPPFGLQVPCGEIDSLSPPARKATARKPARPAAASSAASGE
jgi:hypothetical protein